MATYTTSVAPSNASLASFNAWAAAIETALGNFGWAQQGDTGQYVGVATVFTGVLTSCTTSGGLSTYAYSSLTSGPIPRVGMAFTITGMTNGSNNIAAAGAVVASVVPGVSFTVTSTTQTSGTNESGSTGSATTTALAAPPGVGAYVYEIWKTSDSVGFPVYLKIEYGTNSSTASTPSIAMTIGTGTDGYGVVANASTRFGADNVQANSATLYACHFSGDGGRFSMMMWHGQASTTFIYVFSLERSYDNTGTATGSYYTVTMYSANLTGKTQTLFPTGALTTSETGGWCVALPKTATTGNVGSTTHVSPTFPMVGGVGNPGTNIMVFRATDFADNQIVFITIYGVQQTYITFASNNGNVTSTSVAAGTMVRYS